MSKRWYRLSIHLSEEEAEALEQLAQEWGLSRPATVRKILRQAYYDHGLIGDPEAEYLEFPLIDWEEWIVYEHPEAGLYAPELLQSGFHDKDRL